MTRRTRIGSRVIGVVHQDTRRSLVEALPGLAGVAVLVWWSTDQGGYFQRTWYPGTILLLGVLAATAIGAPASFRGLPRAGLVALGALAAFVAWSFFSISWADAPGPAWDAANRSLLYLILFALFSRATTGRLTRRLILGAWTLSLIVLAVVVLLKLPGVLNAPVRNSDKLHVVERFTLDPGTMRLTRQYEAEDPVYLKGKYTGQDVIQPADAPYTEDTCKELKDVNYSQQTQQRK
jgi:hypothetical protein